MYINLTKLHRKTSISISHLSLIFQGKRRPSLGTAIKMAKALGMSLDGFSTTLETSTRTQRNYRERLQAVENPQVTSE